MRVMIAAFVAQRLRSPVRWLVAITLLGFSALPALLSRDVAGMDATAATFFALVAAAGAIGQDVSSGTITLLLARPVVRWHYVIARWLGATILAAVLSALLMLAVTLGVTARGAAPDPAAVLRVLAELVLTGAAMAAVMIALSSLVNGLADLGLFLAGSTLAGVLQMIGLARHLPWLEVAGRELMATVSPTLSLSPFVRGDWSAWPQLAAWASTLTLSLAVAAWSVSRREYSYAAD